MAHPEAALRHDKRYFLPPRQDLPTYVEEDGRQLPLVLEEGVKEKLPIVVEVIQGDNTLEIEIVRKQKTAGFARTLTGVEVHMRYVEPDRPDSLDPIKIPPPS